MGTWSPARVVAPLALIACLISVVVVVQAARPKSDGSAAVARPAQDARPSRRGARGRPRFYVVRAGDNLTLISERTGVPLDEIERVNPGVDAQTLRVGQRLRLPR